MDPERTPDREQEDDGGTIVPMDVEGMPWHIPNREHAPEGVRHEELTKEQLRMYRWAALKAGLVIALIFGAVFAAFIAFCDFIWFK